MRIQSMNEAIEENRAERDPLPAGSPFKYHDTEEWQGMRKSGEDERDYYLKIFHWLSPLQKLALARHAEDLAKASKLRHSFWARIKATQTYQLVRSAVELGYYALVTLAGSPFSFIIRPINSIYAVAWFGTIYSVLFFVNVAFLFAHVIGFGKLTRAIGKRHASGWSPIHWLDINLFNRKGHLFDKARHAFCSNLVDFERVTKPTDLQPKRPKLQFNVDVARSILLMSSILYERDARSVKKAACSTISKLSIGTGEDSHEPTGSMLWLLRSEEQIYRLAADWGLKFVSMADFRMLSGPFAGAFYDFENIGPEDNPFVVIVVKGTSPDNFSEWLMDCACKFESCGDYLGAGLAHSGFYNTLFSSKGSGAHVLPYSRIVETVKMIAGEAASKTGKKTNLFVGGHSLGAGIAQLLYARFLESPEDLGDQIVLRDGYIFGTPRACDFQLASRVEFNMNRPINQGRQLWRVANRARSPIIGDIVTRVPPGFADTREIRGGLETGSYYAYAAIGTRVDLFPKALGPPFYIIRDLPIGYGVEVYKKSDEVENEFARSRVASKYFWPQDIVQLSMVIITVFVPILHDHFPAVYMSSLDKMQAKTSSKLKGGKQSLKDAHGVPHKVVKHAPPAPNTLSPSRDKSG